MQNVTNGNRSHIVTHRDVEIDAGLPLWARRSNPVVRRELGIFWKRLLPDLTMVGKLLLGQMIAMLILPVSFILTLTLPVAMLAIVLLPVLLFFYGRVLITVINNAAHSITSASNNHTLDLLRVTPIPLSQIILGKIAASVWHRIEDIDLTIMGLTIFSLPFLTIHYLDNSVMADIPYYMRFVALAALVSLPLRAMLEPFMFSSVATALGSVLSTRAAAVVSTLSFMVFYYLLIFVPLAAPMGTVWRIVVEVGLPVLLPLIITLIAVMLTLWHIERQ